MLANVNRIEAPIPRVKCSVETCKFNENGNLCLAEAIEVQGPNARDLQHTDCATFENKR